MNQRSSGIGFHYQITDYGLAGDCQLGLKSPHIPFVVAQQNKVKDEIFNDDVEIALYLQFVSGVSFCFFAVVNCEFVWEFYEL